MRSTTGEQRATSEPWRHSGRYSRILFLNSKLERSLGLRVSGSIPSDRIVPQSVNEGIPAVLLSPRSRVAKSFHSLAERFGPERARRAS